MSNNSGTSRFFITLNRDLIVRLDEYAKSVGMSRSALCAYFIGQGVFGMDKASQFVERAGSAMVSQMMKSATEERGESAAQ